MKGNMATTHPRLLKFFVSNGPYMVILISLPLFVASIYHLYSHLDKYNLVHSALWFGAGILFWSFFEYVIHRWIYHIHIKNDKLRWFLDACHIHHHTNHEDHRTLNAGFGLLYPTAIFIWTIGYFTVGDVFSTAFFLGSLVYYVYYEFIHYYIHYRPSTKRTIRGIQKYHLYHHYHNWNVNFGTTTIFWDLVFRTYDGNYKKLEISEDMKSRFVNWE